MKTKRKLARLSGLQKRRVYETFYLNRYYNLFMNAYKWNNIDYQQIDFIMRKFWADGSVAGFLMKDTIGSELYPNGLMVFTTYAPAEWNIYDFPVKATLINTRGVKFIPTGLQEIDKDVVIGFIQRNKKGVVEMIMPKIQKLALIEIVIEMNLNAHKNPYLLIGSEEDEEMLSNLYDLISSDEDRLYLTSQQADKVKILVTGSQYIIDKLYSYKQCIDNEIREYLGLDNLGINEKKEHLINSEIESNNEVVKASEDSFLDCLQEFCERIRSVFGYQMSVELNKTQPDEYESEDEIESEEEEDEVV